LGTGLGHYIPLVAYLGFWVMCLVSLFGRPLLGLYYMIPFLPYRTMRDHFLDFPLGANVLTILLIAVIVGGILHGKRLPKSKLYPIWLFLGIYLYLSMWIGTAMGNAPPPLWLSNLNFVTWKDYMLIPLVFVAAGLVIEDRKAIRTVIILTAFSVLFIDRSSLFESMTRTWTNFDESKRDSGPLGFGSNQTAAFLAQFGMFFWAFTHFVERKKLKLFGYGIVAITILAAMYTFSRGGYAAILFGVLVFGLMKDRKLLVLLGIFLLTWEAVVPTAVRQRVTMTTSSSSGRLEASAQERVDLWTNAEEAFLHSPIVGNGYATFQLEEHVGDLRDTHNWYVKVLVETGIFGLIPVLLMLQQLLATSYRLSKRASDPLYRGLGAALFVAICSCLIANCFGDRWTYLEITGLLWILVAAAARATELTLSSPELAPIEGVLPTQGNTSPVFATASKTNPWKEYQARFNSTPPLKRRHVLEDEKF
jgi:putative inorganic carbon (hco3(-)) transporter